MSWHEIVALAGGIVVPIAGSVLALAWRMGGLHSRVAAIESGLSRLESLFLARAIKPGE